MDCTKFKVICVTLLSTSFILLFGACQRSPAYKQDQGYFQNEPKSYYTRGGEGVSPTHRVEAMGQPKKRIMVLEFQNDTPVQVGDLGRFAATELKRSLQLTERLIIPTNLKPELATSDVFQGREIKMAQLTREGRRMGVSVLVVGRVSKAVFRQKGDEVGLFRQKQTLAAVDVEIKLIDVLTGRELLTTGKSAESSSNAIVAFENNDLNSPQFRGEMLRLALRRAVDLFVPDVLRVIEKMTWQGHIAKMTGNKIYVNAGKASGLLTGDILKIITLGDEVYDPQTGALLGRTEGKLKGTVEVVDFIGADGAVGQIHTGGNFQVGDQVQLY
jgi:hypothetical protein